MDEKNHPSNTIITQIIKEDYNLSLIKNNIINNVKQEKKNEENNSNKVTILSSISSRKSWWYRICCCNKKNELKHQELKNHVPIESNISEESLLPPPLPHLAGRKTLVLDLDETLVHSSFKQIPKPDFIIPVEIEDQVHNVYVAKRPGVDQFLKHVGKLFEIVVFTASLAKYADPVLDLLDINKVVFARLFREACTHYKGNYVKDLSRLGRNIKNAIIVDNSPSSYLFHPENAVPVESWFDDENDRELLDLIPLFEKLSKCDDVRIVIEEARKNGQFKSEKYLS